MVDGPGPAGRLLLVDSEQAGLQDRRIGDSRRGRPASGIEAGWPRRPGDSFHESPAPTAARRDAAYFLSRDKLRRSLICEKILLCDGVRRA